MTDINKINDAALENVNGGAARTVRNDSRYSVTGTAPPS